MQNTEPQYSYEGRWSHRNARKQLGYGGAVDHRKNQRRVLKDIEKLGYTVRMLTPYQYRINETLDIYVTNNKFHNIKTNERGEYQGIKSLVVSTFGVNSIKEK